MKYFSTRNPNKLYTFKQVVLQGLADDGGLFIPECIPLLTSVQLNSLHKPSFRQLCMMIFPLFIDDIPLKDLEHLVEKSFGKFTHVDVTPLTKLTDQLYILELFHGPTFAFKDIALQFLGNLFEYYLTNSNQHLTIIGATSGDTGSAAIDGVVGKPGISIYMLHPHNRISPIQKAQMTSIIDENVHNIAVEGTFDDCQKIVKDLFADDEWKRATGVHLGAVNSINWARILAQTIYYFYAYFAVIDNVQDQKVSFSVPTGNFGDILAGFYAKRMGLPINTLLIATNRNDILDRFFKEGVYEKHGVHQTLSPAMDIQVSSNFERWLWHFMRDLIKSTLPHQSEDLTRSQASQCVSSWLKSLSIRGRFSTTDQLPVAVHLKEPMLDDARKAFQSCRVDDQEILETIKKYKDQMILDPHTAVGVKAAETRANDVMICLATAHPIKFVGAVLNALEPDLKKEEWEEAEKEVLRGNKEIKGLVVPKEFKKLIDMKQQYEIVENSKDAIKRIIEINI